MDRLTLCRVLTPVILTAALASCGKGASEKDTERPPVRVTTMTVADRELPGSILFSGTVEECAASVISFSTSGTIRTLPVSEGDRISKGQLIGTLDDGSLRNAYNMARTSLEEARDIYARMKILHDSNSLPDIRWVEVESRLRQAESAADIARIALDDARLLSPVSGVVSEKSASVGQTVAPGMPVVKIVDINSVKVCVSVPENEISLYRPGQTATISSAGAEGATFHGTLVEKGVAADPLTRTYTVKFKVANPSGKLLPGMICDVSPGGEQSGDGIILPPEAVLLSSDNTSFVWIDSAGRARKRSIVTDNMVPEGVVVRGGLRNGDKVIVSGTGKVSSGTRVESVK